MVVLGFLLVACEHYETYYYKVDNLSDHDVKVYSEINHNKTVQSTTIVKSHSNETIAKYRGIGDGHDPDTHFPLDTISISSASDTFKIIKEINFNGEDFYENKDNWEFKTLSSTTFEIVMEYTLKLENNNFEKIK